MLDVYCWQGHGNIGDDWLFRSAQELLGRQALTPVVERRRVLSGRNGASHVLVNDSGRTDPAAPLLLWGGGWLAADRSDETLRRWARHLARRRGPTHTFGLGLGPFSSADPRLVDEVLSRIEQPLLVRTAADQRVAESHGVAARISGDAALLWAPEPAPAESRPQRPYVAVALPAFGPHWHTFSSAEEYRRFAVAAVAAVAGDDDVLFVDFQGGGPSSRDSAFWRTEFPHRSSASSVEDMAQVISGARAVVAGRLHAGIMAVLLGRPVVGLRYHHKFDQLTELGIPVVDPQTSRAVPSPVVVDRPRLADAQARARTALRDLEDVFPRSAGLEVVS